MVNIHFHSYIQIKCISLGTSVFSMTADSSTPLSHVDPDLSARLTVTSVGLPLHCRATLVEQLWELKLGDPASGPRLTAFGLWLWLN